MGDPAETKNSKISGLGQFDSIFTELVNDVVTCPAVNAFDTQAAVSWFKEVAEYNVPYGKKNRGLSVVTTFQELKRDHSVEEIKRAQVLGWCVEWLQAFFLVADDVMDGSITRRGNPCWYRKEGVGLTAINDSFFLESAVFQILRKHVRNQPYYLSVIELFHDTIMQTVTGQCMDMTTTPPEGKIDFTLFTMETYSAIVKWKTAFYSFYLPVALAMYMAGISDEAVHSTAKTILLQMGHFFQVQDDYLDCYGTPEVIGKIGTDIQDNKCSWLVVQALSRCTPQQKRVIMENYGRHDATKIERVKEVYKELELPQVYRDYEESSFKHLMNLINTSSGSLPASIFVSFAQKIYKRQK